MNCISVNDTNMLFSNEIYTIKDKFSNVQNILKSLQKIWKTVIHYSEDWIFSFLGWRLLKGSLYNNCMSSAFHTKSMALLEMLNSKIHFFQRK